MSWLNCLLFLLIIKSKFHLILAAQWYLQKPSYKYQQQQKIQLIKDVSITTGSLHTSLTYVEFHKSTKKNPISLVHMANTNNK